MKRTRVTMADVARAAEVTTQTVSRAFRNAPDISKETRERVLRVASELHYVMNGTASSLRGGNSRLIVVVYDNLVNIYFSIMIDYLQNSLREMGYSILMLSVQNPLFDANAYKIAVTHNAAGIITFLEPDREIAEMVEEFSIPVLLLGRRTDLEQVDYLATEDEEGGRIAARRLLKCGCKKLACLTVPLEISCAYDRYHGFSEEAERLGLGTPVLMNAYAASTDENIAALQRAGVDGVFCFNDMIAFDVIHSVVTNRFPPLSVVGYDCVGQEFHIPYRLFSIGADKRALAERAAEIIAGRAEHLDGPRKTEIFGVSEFEGM